MRFQRVLGLPHLGDRRVQNAPTFLETPAFLLMKLKVVVETLAHLLDVSQPVLEVGLRRLLHDALVVERFFLAAQLLTHPFHPRAQRGEHGLLAFQGRGPLLHLGGGGLVFLLHPGERFRLAGQAVVPFVHLHGLFFQVAQVALQLLVALIHLQRPLFQLLFPLIVLGLNAVQPHEIGLVLPLALLQGGALFRDLALALLAFLDPRCQLVLQFLLARRDDLMLLIQGRAFAAELFGAGLVLGLAQFQFLSNRLRLGGLRVELLLVFLEPLGADAESLLFLVEAVAAVAITLVQLLADLAQLAAQRPRLLELLLGALDARRPFLPLAIQFLFAVPPGLFASLEVAFLSPGVADSSPRRLPCGGGIRPRFRRGGDTRGCVPSPTPRLEPATPPRGPRSPATAPVRPARRLRPAAAAPGVKDTATSTLPTVTRSPLLR